MGDKFINIHNSNINNRSSYSSEPKKKQGEEFLRSKVKNDLNELISQNNTSQCLQYISIQIENTSNKKAKIEFIHISSQYSRLMEEMRLDIITQEEFQNAINKINYSLLQFIDLYW